MFAPMPFPQRTLIDPKPRVVSLLIARAIIRVSFNPDENVNQRERMRR